MKTQISSLTLILSLSIFALIFSYCAKEEIQPLTELNAAVSPSAMVESEEVSNYLAKTVNLTDSELNTFEDVLERTSFKAHPDWGVDINAYECTVKGKRTLLVYNPNSSNLNFYKSDRFTVLWFKNGKPIRNANIQLNCVCRGRYAAIVIYNLTNEGIGIAFSAGGNCYEEADSLKEENSTY